MSVARVLTLLQPLLSAWRRRAICSSHKVSLWLWLTPRPQPCPNIGSGWPKGTHSLTGIPTHEPEKCQIDRVTHSSKPAKSRVRFVRFGERKYPASVGRSGIGTQADSLPASCSSQVIRPSKLGKPVACLSPPLPLHLNISQAPLGTHQESSVTHSHHLPGKGSWHQPQYLAQRPLCVSNP